MQVTRLCATIATLAAGLAQPPQVAAQGNGFVTIRVRTGANWAESIAIPGATTLAFRWSWSDHAPTRASWQVSLVSQRTDWPTSPALQRGFIHQPLVRLPSAQGQHSEFQISPRELPVPLPSKFFVRVVTESGGSSYSSTWIQVSVAPVVARPPGTESSR